MSGFEMSAFGPVPIGTPYLDPATTSPEDAARFVIAKPESVLPAQVPAPANQMMAIASVAPRRAVTKPLERRGIVKAVRTRIRDIKAELKHHEALKAELAELERLLNAAKQKPIAPVRPLRSVG